MEPFKEQEDNVWKLKQGNLANVSARRPAARADCPLIRNFRKALLINTPPPYSVNKVLSLIRLLTLLYSSCLEMTRSHCPLQSTGDQEENLTLRATILWWTASLPMPAQNTMPLPIRTAALLGTPSKTLRSGTPEFVRGSRQLCVTVGSGSYAKAYMDTFYLDGEAITASIDESARQVSGSTESIGQGHWAMMPWFWCRGTRFTAWEAAQKNFFFAGTHG